MAIAHLSPLSEKTNPSERKNKGWAARTLSAQRGEREKILYQTSSAGTGNGLKRGEGQLPAKRRKKKHVLLNISSVSRGRKVNPLPSAESHDEGKGSVIVSNADS